MHVNSKGYTESGKEEKHVWKPSNDNTKYLVKGLTLLGHKVKSKVQQD